MEFCVCAVRKATTGSHVLKEGNVCIYINPIIEFYCRWYVLITDQSDAMNLRYIRVHRSIGAGCVRYNHLHTFDVTVTVPRPSGNDRGSEFSCLYVFQSVISVRLSERFHPLNVFVITHVPVGDYSDGISASSRIKSTRISVSSVSSSF